MHPSWRRAVKEFEQHIGELDRSHQTASRQSILDVFLQLAVENGFNSVSMRMIARELDIKAPTLYAHFPDGRDEIVAEALRWHFFRFGTAVMDRIRDVEDPREGWKEMVRVHLTRQVQLPASNLWDLLVATDSVVHFLESGLRHEVDVWIDQYEGLYRAAAIEMGFEACHIPVKIAMAILEGSNRWVMWDGKLTALDDYVETATSTTLALLEGS